MKTKVLAGMFISLFLSFCATSSYIRTPDGTEKTVYYENQIPEHIWRVCLATLKEIGYYISESNKDKGLLKASSGGPIEVEFDSEEVSTHKTQSSTFLLTIMISNRDGKVALSCRVANYGSILESSNSIAEETELRRVLHFLYINLEKSK